jgi:hypothetical protein
MYPHRILLAAAAAVLLPAAGPLDALLWHSRVLLVFAPRTGDPGLAEQERLLAGDRSGFADRDLRVVRVAGDTVTGLSASAADLRHAYGIAPDTFAVRLVGKDGHVATRADRPVASSELFATIDAMPMRRDELRRRGR